MKSRRNFLERAAAVAGAGILGKYLPVREFYSQALIDRIKDYPQSATEDLMQDEQYWAMIKQSYTVSPTVMNLNNGGVSPQPRVVQEAVERYNRLSNEAPSYYMWRILDQGREPLREKLASLAGCSPEELAINRNSSEALETVIFGLPLKAGDEVVLTRQDYPNMINAWKQREKREGIKLNWINFTLPIENEQAIVDEFVRHFTPATKVVHITHMINWMGQILPARRIAEEAKKRGIEVLVDGAHSFAHFEFQIPDLQCDYFGTSLHKWLCAPFGSGLLYVRKEKIPSLFPLFGAEDPLADDIRKFESLGTRSFAIEQAIGQAIDFHLMIGSELKAKRLQFLKNYWASKAAEVPDIRIGTSLDPRFACALCLVNIDGMEPEEIANQLFRDYKIHVVPIDWENIQGVRITPNVYTLTADLDKLVRALKQMASA